MKKITTLLLFLLLINSTLAQVFTPETLGTTRNVQPVEKKEPTKYKNDGMTEWLLWENLEIITYTSQPCWVGWEGNSTPSYTGDESTTQDDRYKCTVSASTGFIDFISGLYKYIFFISLVVGVLVVVVIGIMISLTGIIPEGEEFTNEAKGKIMDIFIGLLALATIPWILKTIAPFFF
jgi:hypothetical protein